MKPSEYLYGVNSKEWADLKWKDALKKRIKLSTTLLEKLSTKSTEIFGKPEYKEEYQKLTVRMTEIIKAIEFNKNLLKELQ